MGAFYQLPFSIYDGLMNIHDQYWQLDSPCHFRICITFFVLFISLFACAVEKTHLEHILFEHFIIYIKYMSLAVH